jgi:hypothetical protein
MKPINNINVQLLFSEEEILDEVNESIHYWRKTADLYGVSRESKNTIAKIICPKKGFAF